jgi:thymidine kinase
VERYGGGNNKMISLIFGPMFSGKSTELLRRLERAHIANKRVIMLRPLTDTRSFLSHSERNNDWLKQEFVELEKFDASKYDVIGIDESQFFSGLKEFCLKYSLAGKRVIVSALHATSESEMFEEIVKLLPYCEEIVKLNAICTKCGADDATYTLHLAGSKTDKVAVGGTEAYAARCDKCYFIDTIREPI